MSQPVPYVTESDVQRIAQRDFGAPQAPLALSILAEFGKQEWNHSSSPRVQLAILKLADGDLDRLLDATHTAINDWRDLVAYAEYPRYMRQIGLRDVPQSVKDAVMEDDWREYQDWLQRESPPGEDERLVDELLASNPEFQALVAKSKASPRKPFAPGP